MKLFRRFRAMAVTDCAADPGAPPDHKPMQGLQMETLDMIRRLAADTLNIAEEPLLRANTLREAGIDSLAAIDLVFALEAHYGVTIAAGELANVSSLRDLAAIVDRLTTRAAQRHGS